MDPNPGLGCPQCGFRIPISIQMLLSGQPIGCPACHLELRVNREESKETLNALEKVAEAIAKTDEAKRGYQ
ncbi:MAG: hypothetical protein HZA04_09275 [Nitrospinae bacterium]|nr:hypothetical protein [Nitrospinota bacterium]